MVVRAVQHSLKMALGYTFSTFCLKCDHQSKNPCIALERKQHAMGNRASQQAHKVP